MFPSSHRFIRFLERNDGNVPVLLSYSEFEFIVTLIVKKVSENAIKKLLPEVSIIRCWKHLFKSLEFRIRSNGG